MAERGENLYNLALNPTYIVAILKERLAWQPLSTIR
jgi:hypothetical protein